jgi:hypothetical protein
MAGRPTRGNMDTGAEAAASLKVSVSSFRKSRVAFNS